MKFQTELITFEDLKEIKDLEVLSFLMIILLSSEKIIDENQVSQYGLTPVEVNQILRKMRKYFEVTKFDDLILISAESKSDNATFIKIKKVWGLSEEITNKLKDSLNLEKTLNEYVYDKKNIQTSLSKKPNQDNLLEIYYKVALLGDIIKEKQVALSRTDIKVINSLLLSTKLEPEIFKFCFEYSIELSTYQSFINQLFEKIVKTFERMNIDTIDAARKFSKEREEYLKKSTKKYVNTIKKPKQNKSKITAEELAELKRIIDESD